MPRDTGMQHAVKWQLKVDFYQMNRNKRNETKRVFKYVKNLSKVENRQRKKPENKKKNRLKQHKTNGYTPSKSY